MFLSNIGLKHNELDILRLIPPICLNIGGYYLFALIQCECLCLGDVELSMDFYFLLGVVKEAEGYQAVEFVAAEREVLDGVAVGYWA